MTIPKFKSIQLNFILKNYFGEDVDFKEQDYGFHRPNTCNCECSKITLKYKEDQENIFNKFVDFNGITSNILTKIGQMTEVEIEMKSNVIRQLFHQSYKQIFPNPEQYFNKINNSPEEINLLIFKELNDPNVKYEVINKGVCEFCKNNIANIERALYVKYISSIWYIEGTGCSCSSFLPLHPDEITKLELLNILLTTMS